MAQRFELDEWQDRIDELAELLEVETERREVALQCSIAAHSLVPRNDRDAVIKARDLLRQAVEALDSVKSRATPLTADDVEDQGFGRGP